MLRNGETSKAIGSLLEWTEEDIAEGNESVAVAVLRPWHHRNPSYTTVVMVTLK